MALTFYFSEHNRTTEGWRREDPSKSPFFNAKKWAERYGAAGVFRADDSFTMYYRDQENKVRRKTWPYAKPQNSEAA